MYQGSPQDNGRYRPIGLGELTTNTPGFVTEVARRMAEALAALSQQRTFWGDARVQRDSQAAEFRHRT